MSRSLADAVNASVRGRSRNGYVLPFCKVGDIIVPPFHPEFLAQVDRLDEEQVCWKTTHILAMHLDRYGEKLAGKRALYRLEKYFRTPEDSGYESIVYDGMSCSMADTFEYLPINKEDTRVTKTVDLPDAACLHRIGDATYLDETIPFRNIGLKGFHNWDENITRNLERWNSDEYERVLGLSDTEKEWVEQTKDVSGLIEDGEVLL